MIKAKIKTLFSVLIINCLMINLASAQSKNPIENILYNNPSLFKSVLDHPQKNEIQIIYTQINRDAKQKATFKTFSFNLDDQRYFYPASTIKLPAAIFALEKLNELKIDGLDKNISLKIEKSFGEQTAVSADLSSQNGKPSIANYIKKILLVSDNDAYNRIYEFVGRSEINQKLKKYGFNQTRIISRLSVGDGGENAKYTNPFDFLNDKGETIYKQLQAFDAKEYPFQLNNYKQGIGYKDRNDSLVMQPFDFSKMNAFQLSNQHELMKKLFFPENYPKKNQFNLKADDYDFLYSFMSKYPTESTYPTYSAKDDYASYCKFLFYGADEKKPIDTNIRIFNKVGDAYGYTIDNIYFIDYENKVEFILSAVIQSNEDGIYNDNKYEYTTVCLPFLRHLGEKVYDFELNRTKKYEPNLTKYLKFK
jgi:hypothetical protein